METKKNKNLKDDRRINEYVKVNNEVNNKLGEKSERDMN